MTPETIPPPAPQPRAVFLIRAVGSLSALSAGVVLVLQEEREIGIGLIVAGVAGFGLTSKLGRPK